MAFIEWTEKLSTGIYGVDDQHLRFIELLNDLYVHIASNSTKEALMHTVHELKNYTVYHFNTEEKHMAQYNYPHFKSHKAEHDDFTNYILGIEDKLKKGQFVITLSITNFMKKWIEFHILETDKMMGDYLLKHGYTDEC